ncbi:hypothetical protein J3454_15585 [Erythrobacter sp. NFXS35]|uniref:hypothetical protein n=1 Tax=Erythrobacter sp. NFXS35 TaxID=2818436 RepID=UPI0032DE78CD
MIDHSKHQQEVGALDRAISLAEAALDECDESGFIYAAIDISSAIDKLKALKLDQASQ